MDINPFELIKNFQNIQSQMKEVQERLRAVEVTGTAGGGMVTVAMNGQLEVHRVSISRDAVNPEDVGMLEDLVRAAFIDASAKVKEKLQEEMSSATGGLQFPPGFMGT